MHVQGICAVEEFGSARAPPSHEYKKKKQWRKIEMRVPHLHIHKICFSANLLSYLSNYVQCHNILSEQKF